MRGGAAFGLLILALGAQTATRAQTAPSAEELFRKAVSAQRQGDDAAAIQAYQELLKLRPDVMEVHANLGAVYAHAGRFQDAVGEYETALAKAPQNRAIQFNLALAYYKAANWAKAAEILSTLNKEDAGDARAAALLADCDLHLDRAEEAVAVAKAARTAHPDNTDISRVLAQALLRAGKLPEAERELEQLAEATNDAGTYLLAGKTALQLNRFEIAKREAMKAAELQPGLAGVDTLLGMTLDYLNDEQGARAALERAVAANPNDFQAQLTLGSLLNNERDLENAETHIRRALVLDPSSTLARYEMARVERAKGNTEAALADFEAVEKADPNWQPPHVALAALYAQQKRLKDAAREREIVDRLEAVNQKKEVQAAGPPKPEHP